MIKGFEIIEILVEEGVHLGSKLEDSLLPKVVLKGGILLLCNVV